MNIFEQYLEKIIETIDALNQDHMIKLSEEEVGVQDQLPKTIKRIIEKLFKIIKSNPRKFLTKEQLTKDKYRAISDFISGMTDRYAINLYNDNK